MKTDYPHLIFGVTEPNTNCLKLCRKQVNKLGSKVKSSETETGVCPPYQLIIPILECRSQSCHYRPLPPYTHHEKANICVQVDLDILDVSTTGTGSHQEHLTTR